MNIKDAFIQSIQEVLPVFKVKPKFIYEEESTFLTSADQVNILNSFSHSLEGNIIFGLSKTRAFQIASLVNEKDTTTFDAETRRAITDITTFAINIAISKFQAVNSIYISPPVFITGNDAYMMINRVNATKLVFQINDDLLSVAYSIEESSGAF